jgi:hypothetical protein
MYDEFLAFLSDNKEEALRVFNDYYYEKAEDEGCEMQGDERFYGEDGYDYDPTDLYEDFAHCTGYSASYHGAYGVIQEYADEFDSSELDPEDEDLQELVLEVLEQDTGF